MTTKVLRRRCETALRIGSSQTKLALVRQALQGGPAVCCHERQAIQTGAEVVLCRRGMLAGRTPCC